MEEVNEKPTTRRRPLPWILALLLLVLAAWLWLPPGAEPGSQPTGRIGHARDDPVEAFPAPQPSLPSKVTTESHAPPTGARLVVHCAGAPDAVAFASFAPVDGALATERGALSDGSARLELPPEWFADAKPVALQVGIAGIGVVKTTRAFRIARGETKEVTLVADAGLTITGRVVDTNGAGIPALRIVAKTMQRPGPKQPGMYDSDDLLYSAQDFVEARAVSGRDGGFLLRGLEDRHYFLTVSNLEWVIVPSHRPAMTPPLVDVVLVAERAYRLDIAVTDAQTDEPLSRGSARLRDVGGMHFSCGIRNGRGAVVWQARRAAMLEGSGFDFMLEVRAFGYESKFVKVEFAPRERTLSLSVELKPRPMGELVFEVTAAAGGEVRGPLTVYASRTYEGYTLRLVRDPGTDTFRVRVPAGSWKVSVCPAGALGGENLATWSDRMRVPEDGVATAKVLLGAHGSLRVDRGRFPGVLLHLTVAGRKICVGIGESYQRVAAVRAGAWPYTVEATVDGGTRKIQEGTVEIHAGEETVLRVE